MHFKRRSVLKTFCLAGGFFLAIQFSSGAFADIIRVKGGQEITAKILERKKDLIKVEDARGKVAVYFLEDLEKIGGEIINPSEVTRVSAIGAVSGDASALFDMASRSVVYIQNKTASGAESIGSGFVISPDGVIVTNNHVAARAQELTVRFKDGQVYPAERVLWKDAVKDIFVFKISGLNLSALPLADWKDTRIGERVFVIGNPLGMDYSFSDGMVAATRNLQGTRHLQFTAPISPGNSGGPVFNANGEVLEFRVMIVEL